MHLFDLHLVEEFLDFWTTRLRRLLRFGALRRSFFGSRFCRILVRRLSKATPKDISGDSYAGVSMTGRATILVFTISSYSELFLGISDCFVTLLSGAEFWTALEFLWDITAHKQRNEECKYLIFIYVSQGILS